MKLWNYVFLLTGLSVVFALAGMDVAGISDLLTLIGLEVTSTGLGTFAVQNTLWNKIFGTTGLLTAITTTGAVGVGLYLYTKDKSYLILPLITGVLFYWGSVLVSLVQQKGGYEVFGIIVGIIGVVLTVGFIMSCVDYFLGTD